MATKPQGDLSNIRPSWAAHSLTKGDLIVDKDQRSVIGTLVERNTRIVRLRHLLRRDCDTLRQELTPRMADPPTQLLRSIT